MKITDQKGITPPGINVSGYLNGDTKESVWFDFREDCQVQIQYLSPRILRVLKREATRKEFVGGQLVEDFDEELFNKRLAEEIISDWTGFCDERGETIPCTPENRRLLMDNWTEFNLFVQNASANLERCQHQKEEREIKN